MENCITFEDQLAEIKNGFNRGLTEAEPRDPLLQELKGRQDKLLVAMLNESDDRVVSLVEKLIH